jgi:hypothetical protein
MEEIKICFIDDSVSVVGGTSLTIDAIIEPNIKNVDFVSTREFSLKNLFADYDFFILGNLTSFTKNSLDAILHMMEQKPFCKIEFDYGYCEYRGTIPHKIIAGEDCSCPFGDSGNLVFSKIYSLVKSNSLHTFYMSGAQMKIHSRQLNWDDHTRKSVLSSCFTSETLSLFKELKKKNKNNKYAIIDGQGGWHTQAKGIKESIEYAKANNIEYDLIKTETHKEMLHLLSQYKGLIFLPIIEDTCPRVTIEARYMGLDVITDDNSQHIKEDWWKADDSYAFDFTKSRPNYFWKILKCLK